MLQNTVRFAAKRSDNCYQTQGYMQQNAKLKPTFNNKIRKKTTVFCLLLRHRHQSSTW